MSDEQRPSNVIQFPDINVSPSAPTSPEDALEKLNNYKESYSTELAELMWESVLGEMARAGCEFDLDIDKYFPGMVLVFEAIKSLHLSTMNVHHPLQDYARDNVIVFHADGQSARGGFKRNDNDGEKTVDIDGEID